MVQEAYYSFRRSPANQQPLDLGLRLKFAKFLNEINGLGTAKFIQSYKKKREKLSHTKVVYVDRYFSLIDISQLRKQALFIPK